MIRLVNALIWRYRQKLLHTSDVGKPCQRDYKKHFIGKLSHRKRQGQKQVLVVVVVVTRKEETSLLLFVLVSLLSSSNSPFSPTCLAYEVKSCLGSIWTCGRVEVVGRSIECRNKDICSFLSSPRLIKSWINWVRRVARVGDTIIAYIVVIFVERLEGIWPVTKTDGGIVLKQSLEIETGDLTWIRLAQDRDLWQALYMHWGTLTLRNTWATSFLRSWMTVFQGLLQS